MKKEYNYVYITTNLITSRQYVGDHSTNNINDSYLGSGDILKKKVKEYGKENFKREILEFFDSKKEAFVAQEKYINLYKSHVSQGGYNISWKGGHNVKDCISEETKKKISKSEKGKKISDEHKLKISKFNKGKTLSKEHIEKLINYNTGRVVSKKTREKISKSKTGVPLSLEHKKKINHEGIKNPMYGKTHSNESKEKMRKRKEGFVAWNKGLNTKSLKKR